MGLGNVFGGSFGNILGAALPVLGGVVGSIIPGFGTVAGAAVGGIAGQLLTGGPEAGGAVQSSAGLPVDYGTQWVGGGQVIPDIQQLTGVGSFLEQPTNGEVQQVALPAAVGLVGMSRALALALARVASRLGVAVTLATISRFGLRLYRSLSAFARRHPAISIAGILASLGMTAAEVAEFLTWGATKRRRRRGGISGRDMRIARRTIRRISAFQADLGGMRRGGRRGLAARGGVQVVRAG